ncbi:MAG TPA: hypothetical protein VEY87_01435 [Gaiellaceae bacterium]|nr:hypothetical protein [Gaiellaceae bacterium]
MRPLDAYLPVYEFSERHRVSVAASPERIDRALRGVTFAELPLARALFVLRGLGRLRAGAPALATMTRSAVVLEDEPGSGIVVGLTGQFWRLRGGDPAARCRTREEFAAFDRPDACQAVVDFRAAAGILTTETRVHVRGEEARHSFDRYWRVIRPFSGLTRTLLLRAAKRRAER